jgi:hypothetical protein
MPPKLPPAPIPGGPGWKDKEVKGEDEKGFWGTDWRGQPQWPRPQAAKTNPSSSKSVSVKSVRTGSSASAKVGPTTLKRSPANSTLQSENDGSSAAQPGAPERRDIEDMMPQVLKNDYVESEVDRIEELLAMQSKLRDQCYIIKPSVYVPVKPECEEIVDRQGLLRRLMKQLHEMGEQHKKALSEIAHMDKEITKPFCKWYGEMANIMAIPWGEVKGMDLPMTNMMITRVQALAVGIGEELVRLEGIALEETFEANEDLLRMLAHSRSG